MICGEDATPAPEKYTSSPVSQAPVKISPVLAAVEFTGLVMVTTGETVSRTTLVVTVVELLAASV